ncbi:MAG TPA: hypothetical protein VKS60_02480 [Stellaceae bacterium]|nr:hypothetical protein [Stellaceae bacterium]
MTSRLAFAAQIALALSIMLPALATTASADPAGPTCIRVRDIRSTSTPDDRTIIYWMKDGTKLASKLDSACIGLSFSGWVYAPDQNEMVCSNVQKIKLLQTNSLCQLGPFTPVAAATPAAASH